ncbi:MAG: pilus assembly protein CpaA [Phenylobacterium zucineum]|nr:MAG: pilus assembly protein CpaA [Phenylobacterium zucineum]
MQTLQVVLLTVFPAMVIVAGLRDMVSYTIPNWISFGTLLAFFPTAFVLGLPANIIWLNLAAGAMALILGIVMFALGWIGGGDAKLFAASGLWLGFPGFFGFTLVTAIAGGLLAVGLLGMRSLWVRRYVVGGPPWFERLTTHGENVPYGIAIAAGALFTYPSSALMQAFTSAL